MEKYPERKCATIYSKRDLEKWFNLLSMRTSLKYAVVDKEIAGRYYQEAAIKAVCSSFEEKNRRKALLVMATGSGKTRTVIALCKVLMDARWVEEYSVSGRQKFSCYAGQNEVLRICCGICPVQIW